MQRARLHLTSVYVKADKTARCVIKGSRGRGPWLGGKTNSAINQFTNYSITQSIDQLNIRSKSVFKIRSNSNQDPFKIRSRSVQDPFTIRSRSGDSAPRHRQCNQLLFSVLRKRHGEMQNKNAPNGRVCVKQCFLEWGRGWGWGASISRSVQDPWNKRPRAWIPISQAASWNNLETQHPARAHIYLAASRRTCPHGCYDNYPTPAQMPRHRLQRAGIEQRRAPQAAPGKLLFVSQARRRLRCY